MIYSCMKCKRDLNIKAGGDYCCPFCGENLICEEEIPSNELGDEGSIVEEYMRDIDDDKLDEIVSNEYEIRKKSEKKGLEGVRDNIEALFGLLKDPNAEKKNKLIAGALLLYLFNPVDIVPDAIPLAGLLDDATVIAYGVKLIGGMIDKYKKYKNNGVRPSKNLLYYVVGDNQKPEYDYEEDSNMKILYMNRNNRYGFEVFGGKLMKANKLYIAHPYVTKSLIPFEEYDKIIADCILEEKIELLSMLGAKRISCEIIEDKKSSSNVNMGFNVMGIFGKGKADSKADVRDSSAMRSESEYEYVDSYDLGKIDELIWFFTDERNEFQDIFRDRILKGLKSKTIYSQYSTSTQIDAGLRGEVVKKGSLKIDCKSSKAVERKVMIDVEFYDRPSIVIADPEKFYEEIESRIESRRALLKSPFEILEEDKED